MKLSKKELKKQKDTLRSDAVRKLDEMAYMGDVRCIAWVANSIDDKTKEWIMELSKHVDVPFQEVI